MASRKVLKCVVKGLYDSFISRNNDVAGYWGIGKLCLFSQDQNQNVIVIDLFQSSVLPRTHDFDLLASGFSRRLRTLIAGKGIPEEWVKSAKIIIDFKPTERPEKYPPILSWGKLFQLTVILEDDRSHKYVQPGYGHCSPHDPHRESKSGGSERY
jgi:hypothetical protein